ncbi:uncharacterized protein [Watersipora subatra]|uniref:uncharacterized protein isoform X1 n=1 Tax=Watersipora subatra TaxID=2589382 RepID=UPI00355B5D6C
MQQQQTQQASQVVGQQQQIMQPTQSQFDTQSGFTIVTQNRQEDIYKLHPTALSQLKRWPLAQMVMGGLCILFGIILISVEASTYYGSKFSSIGYGIWSGAYLLIVGGIGLCAVKRNTGSWISATIVVSFTFLIMMFVSLLEMVSTVLSETSVSSSCGYSYFTCGYHNIKTISTTFNVLLLLTSVAGLIVFICRNYCHSTCLTSQEWYAYPDLSTQQQSEDDPKAPLDSQKSQVNLHGLQKFMIFQSFTAPTPVHQMLVVTDDAKPVRTET